MTDLLHERSSAWPAKLTREQQKTGKQRGKEFDLALKRGARAAGWRYARGTAFQQSGDWFISILPSLLWQRGAVARMMIKPMALDPLFWNIVGLHENEKLPLSFRATGAWVLRPPSMDENVGLDLVEIERLATDVLKWGNRQTSEMLHTFSVEAMLATLPSEEDLRGQPRALAICLHILEGDLNSALGLCRVDDPDVHPLVREGGGFTTHNRDGSISTFLDQAYDWIARRRRDECSVV